MTRCYDSADTAKMLALLPQSHGVMYACFGL